jgi:hypothetical protein
MAEPKLADVPDRQSMSSSRDDTENPFAYPRKSLFFMLLALEMRQQTRHQRQPWFSFSSVLLTQLSFLFLQNKDCVVQYRGYMCTLELYLFHVKGFVR